MIEKSRIQELIKVFYQQPFKIFYVNSVDGETFIKPTGLFISLGLTTSMRTIEGLRDVISNTYPESNPLVVELSSKCMTGDQYLNTITDNQNPQPYVISEFPENSFDKTMAFIPLAMVSLYSHNSSLPRCFPISSIIWVRLVPIPLPIL